MADDTSVCYDFTQSQLEMDLPLKHTKNTIWKISFMDSQAHRSNIKQVT